MTPTENIHTLAGPYVLDALDDLERVRFEAHLDACDSCMLETAEFLDTAALLGQIEELPVPAGFKERVLSEIDTIRQVGPLRAPTRRLAPRLISVAAAVMAVAVIGLSVVTAGLRAENADLAVFAAAAQILTQDDAVSVEQALGAATLRLIASEHAGEGAILASGMEAAPNGHAYQLWLIDAEGNALPAGFLEIGGDGSGEQLMVGDMTGITAVGISVEPAAGSESPTTTPIAVVPISA